MKFLDPFKLKRKGLMKVSVICSRCEGKFFSSSSIDDTAERKFHTHSHIHAWHPWYLYTQVGVPTSYHPLDGRPLCVQSSDEQQASRINDTIKARDKQIDRQSGEIDTYIQRHWKNFSTHLSSYSFYVRLWSLLTMGNHNIQEKCKSWSLKKKINHAGST